MDGVIPPHLIGTLASVPSAIGPHYEIRTKQETVILLLVANLEQFVFGSKGYPFKVRLFLLTGKLTLKLAEPGIENFTQIESTEEWKGFMARVIYPDYRFLITAMKEATVLVCADSPHFSLNAPLPSFSGFS